MKRIQQQVDPYSTGASSSFCSREWHAEGYHVDITSINSIQLDTISFKSVLQEIFTEEIDST